MSLGPYSGSPQCGTCGTYFSPGQVICSVCGAHRYGPDAPVVGPLAQRSVGQNIQRWFWWALSGAGLVLCVVVGTAFGLLHFLLQLLPIFH
ncbi:MAG TPA: hypothetical protein VKT82_07320 [Ktedonobacterales bacterium]|nr:hypothetical protein [Ktedonobacterales bacterium]